jgi:DNA uptake protein ComE-like DNA-binding protein
MWILVVLTVLSLSLAGSMRSYLGQSRQLQTLTLASEAGPSALAVAQQVLISDPPSADHASDAWGRDDPSTFVRLLNGGKLVLFQVGDEQPQLGLADEAARLNANTATPAMLARLPGMDVATAETFVTLRNELAAAKAREQQVARKPNGWTGPIETEAQLADLLRRAMPTGGGSTDIASDPTAPWNNPMQLEPAVATALRHLTIFSHVVNRDALGRRRININTADLSELSEAFNHELTTTQLAAIDAARQQRSFRNIGELLTRDLPVKETDGRTTIERINVSQFAPAADRLTVTSQPVLLGLVNINTASPQVLRCLPGLSDDHVQLLLTERDRLDRRDRESIAWLLNVLSTDQFERLCPHVTARSGQFRVNWAFLREGSATASYGQAVLDREGDTVAVPAYSEYRARQLDPQNPQSAMSPNTPF